MSVQRSTTREDEPLESKTVWWSHRTLEPFGSNPTEVSKFLEISPESNLEWHILQIDYDVSFQHTDASQDNPSDGVFCYWEVTPDDRIIDIPRFNGPGSGNGSDADTVRENVDTARGDDRLIAHHSEANCTMNDNTDGLATTGDQGNRLTWTDSWTSPEGEPFILDFRSELNINLAYNESLASVADNVLAFVGSMTIWFKDQEVRR